MTVRHPKTGAQARHRRRKPQRTRPRRERLWRIPPSQWPALLARVVRESAHDRVTMFAASLAFHAFLALLPVVIAVVGLLDLAGLSSSQLHTLVHDTSVLLPRQMSSVLNQQLIAPPSRQVNVAEVVFGLAVALWSSVEAMAALEVALDAAYEVQQDRGLIGRRLVALPLIGVTVVLGGVASVLLVLGGPISHLVPTDFDVALSVLRYGGSLLLVTLLLSTYYGVGPARNQVGWELISPGSAAAAAGWVLVALGFSYYLNHFGHETRTYGALAGVAVTLLWLFITALVVLFGAELNRELERRAARRDSGPGPSAQGGSVCAESD